MTIRSFAKLALVSLLVTGCSSEAEPRRVETTEQGWHVGHYDGSYRVTPTALGLHGGAAVWTPAGSTSAGFDQSTALSGGHLPAGFFDPPRAKVDAAIDALDVPAPQKAQLKAQSATFFADLTAAIDTALDDLPDQMTIKQTGLFVGSATFDGKSMGVLYNSANGDFFAGTILGKDGGSSGKLAGLVIGTSTYAGNLARGTARLSIDGAALLGVEGAGAIAVNLGVSVDTSLTAR
jgi:hypothetical protein